MIKAVIQKSDFKLDNDNLLSEKVLFSDDPLKTKLNSVEKELVTLLNNNNLPSDLKMKVYSNILAKGKNLKHIKQSSTKASSDKIIKNETNPFIKVLKNQKEYIDQLIRHEIETENMEQEEEEEEKPKKKTLKKKLFTPKRSNRLKKRYQSSPKTPRKKINTKKRRLEIEDDSDSYDLDLLDPDF